MSELATIPIIAAFDEIGSPTKRAAIEPLLSKTSAPETEPRDQRPVTLDVLSAQVVEQTATLADQHQQPAAAVVVVLVLAEVLGEVVDPFGQDRHLHLGRARVAVVVPEFGHDLLGGLHCA